MFVDLFEVHGAEAALVDHQLYRVQPTVGVDLIPVKRPRKHTRQNGSRGRKKRPVFIAREVGGTFVPLWYNYLATSTAVVFVMDMSSVETMPTSITEYLDVKAKLGDLAVETRSTPQPLCIFANKTDFPCTWSLDCVRRAFAGMLDDDDIVVPAFSRASQLSSWIRAVAVDG